MKKAKPPRPTTVQETTLTTANIRLVVGLGNPGPKYTETRHNAGFLVVDELAKRMSAEFKSPRFSLRKRVAEEAKAATLTLIKPLTFMNRSGQAVQAYATKLSVKPEQILLVHDDLDLPLGRLRFRAEGSAGGQRGVQDTINRIGPKFLRLKVGIGRPPERWTVENWVLSKFRAEEQALLEKVVTAAADGVEKLLAEGLDAAMQAYNGLDLRPEAAKASNSETPA